MGGKSFSKYSRDLRIDATHSELVLLRQLIHTKDSNDILERLVVLEDLLHSGGDLVVLRTDL